MPNNSRRQDAVVHKLREKKLPVTVDNYALFAFWREYETLTAEEKMDVEDAVYEGNIQ